MLNFKEAQEKLALNTGAKESPLDLMFRSYGHYRLDHFDQPVLEDLRQRLSRQGVSLYGFSTECLPAIYSMLHYAVDNDIITHIPKLFHYKIEKIELRDVAHNWIDCLEDQMAQSTIERYRRILEDWIMPRLGDLDLCALDGSTIEKYKEVFLTSGGTPSTFLFHQRIIYGIIDFMVAEKINEDRDIVGYLEAKKNRQHPVSLESVALKWLDSVEEDTKESLEEREVIQSYLIPLLGRTDISSDYRRRLIEYRKELARLGEGEKAFLTHISVINKLRKYALLRGWMKKASVLKAPPKKQIAERLPTEQERERILQYWSGEPDSLILCLAGQMGLQNEEIRQLKWKDIDLDQKVAIVSNRQVPIPSDFVKILECVRKANGGDGYVVLTARKKFGPVSMAYLIVSAQKLLQKYGIAHIRLDDLRNDYIIRKLKVKSPECVAKECGFLDVGVLMERYVDFIP